MEDDYYPKTLQEELNEIVEAFYAIVSEEDIRKYQQSVEELEKRSIAEGAIKAPSRAPDFELEDQDGDRVHLSALLERGPVVIIFYRGKWCPMCNATLMRLQRHLDQIEAKGATLVAISPMLPDGTQVLSSKKSLQFPVLSDLGNEVARKYKITFRVPENVRETMLSWGEDVPTHNGDDTWEIPLPATYIISQEGQIVWSFIEDDPIYRAELEDIVAAIPTTRPSLDLKKVEGENDLKKVEGENDLKKVEDENDVKKVEGEEAMPKNMNSKNERKKRIRSTFKSSMKSLFGKKKQKPEEYLSNYMVGDDA